MASHFENYAHEGNKFINRIADEMGYPKDHELAFRITRAVFRALRDRITVEESMHLISELPMALKAVYVEGWDITRRRTTYTTKQDMLVDIIGQLQTGLLDFAFEPEEKVKAVFHVLRDSISEGEIQHIISQLNPEMAELLVC
jgi:uncharacterized protein (DUF2267 family)